MGMVPHKEFTTGSQVLANAAAVRERLMNPNKYTKALEAKISRLEQTIEEQSSVIENKTETIERLKLDVADLQASILCQAHMIVDSYRASSGEESRCFRRSPRQIIEAVLMREYPHITFSDIIGPRRHKTLVEPRHKCVAAVYIERVDLSLPQIGKIFNRDHTTVLHAINKLGAKRGQA